MPRPAAAWNAHDLERVATFYAPHVVGIDVGQAEPQHGPRERVSGLAAYKRAFPNLHFTGEPIVEGNRAVLIWTTTGTHRGTFMRIPPTERRIEVRGASVLTFEGNLVVRGLTIWDTAGLLRALGLLPEL